MKILVVEDNLDLISNIFAYLESKHYILDAAYDAETALQLCLKHHYDVLIIDWMLPKMSGIALIQQLRGREINTPIIMLTAKTELEDKLTAFQAGGDDYLTKPFSLQELEARIIALNTLYKGRKKIIQVCDLIYDLSKDEVTRQGQTIHLHTATKKILAMLMRASPNIVDRQQLAYAVWGDDLPEKDVLRTHIYDLRKKIDTHFATKLLKTIPKIGYQLIRSDDALHD